MSGRRFLLHSPQTRCREFLPPTDSKACCAVCTKHRGPSLHRAVQARHPAHNACIPQPQEDQQSRGPYFSLPRCHAWCACRRPAEIASSCSLATQHQPDHSLLTRQAPLFTRVMLTGAANAVLSDSTSHLQHHGYGQCWQVDSDAARARRGAHRHKCTDHGLPVFQ